MGSLQELLAQKAELERQIAAAQQRDRAEVVSKIRSLMSDYGLTMDDVLAGQSGKPAGKRAGVKLEARYRDPSTGQTWSGRGLQPRWLRDAVAGGKRVSDFAV